MSETSRETYLVNGAESSNSIAPELGSELEPLAAQIESVQVINDPAFDAYKIQTLGHLRHVSFDFKLAEDSPDYVHAPVIAGPYPIDPTTRQIEKANNFLRIVNGENQVDTTPFGAENLDELEELQRTQSVIDRKLINDADTSYADFKQRLDEDGFDAEFPEFAPTLEYVQKRLLSGKDVAEGCSQSNLVAQLREVALQAIEGARIGDDQQAKTPKYRESIYALETALEFFDVMQRSGEDTPPLYHSDRYEYYLHFLLGQQDHVIYPTIAPTGATDLMKLRHVPVGIAGVTTETTYVDGFPQSSYEFFHHDINHSRRMYQFFKEKAVELDITPEELSAQGSQLMAEDLLPVIKIRPTDTEERRQLKRTSRMLLFEIMHEDALPAERGTILKAMFRQPLERTPFERIDGNTVEYFMEEGATTLAYAYRKLAHTFYDRPGERMSALGSEDLRNRYVVVNAAMEIFRALGGNGMRDEDALAEFEQLVSTDEGFPDAFFETVTDDIDARKDGKNGDFGFFVALPKSAEETIKELKGIGKKVVTLFGYSDLGYAQPQMLERHIGEDLQSYDPEDTVIVSGATAAGIGKGYDIAADMGFQTAGIVSTKVLSHDGKFSPNAGDIHLVRDAQWGGYVPKSTVKMSPTTEAFVGSADVLLSYGGGYNTAVALREAKRRGGIELKHRQHAMSEDGQADGSDPYGEAQHVWREFTSAE